MTQPDLASCGLGADEAEQRCVQDSFEISALVQGQYGAFDLEDFRSLTVDNGTVDAQAWRVNAGGEDVRIVDVGMPGGACRVNVTG